MTDHLPATRAAGDLAGYVAHCDEPAGYLDFAHVGPPLRAAVDARHAALRVTGTSDPVRPLEKIREEARRRAVAVIGGDVEVTFEASTTAGLFAVAFGLAGSGTLLVPEGEFPANAVPWLRAAARGGPAVRRVPRDTERITAGALRSALTPDVAGLTVSAVDYRTGWKAPSPSYVRCSVPTACSSSTPSRASGSPSWTWTPRTWWWPRPEVAALRVGRGDPRGAAPRAETDRARPRWLDGPGRPLRGSAGTELGAPAKGPDRLLTTNTDLEAIAGLNASSGWSSRPVRHDCPTGSGRSSPCCSTCCVTAGRKSSETTGGVATGGDRVLPAAR
ncbi:aminotransferase class V-fold PLP-dependent enzyme [Streptosporangium lutulentum]